MTKHSEKRKVPYTPLKMFDLVADIEKYPEFLPWCVASRVISNDNNILIADLMIGFQVFKEKFRSRVKLDKKNIYIIYNLLSNYAEMRDVFNLVPSLLKESAYGVGATTWEVVKKVVLPYTKIGVVGGVMLGLGRALGETMAVTFVIGNAHRLSSSIINPGNSIASSLANEFTEADGVLYTSSLIELGLILFLITSIVLGLSKLMLMRIGRLEGSKT